MPKKGGPGSRKSVRVEEKAALEAEQAAAVVDAQTAAKEAQAVADAAAEELAVYRAEVASAAEAAEQKAAAELAELKEQWLRRRRAAPGVHRRARHHRSGVGAVQRRPSVETVRAGRDAGGPLGPAVRDIHAFGSPFMAGPFWRDVSVAWPRPRLGARRLRERLTRHLHGCVAHPR